MFSLNKVQVIGNLGKDPEVKYLANGTALVNMTIATSQSWMDKQTGQKQEKTEWHRVVMFGKPAEIIGQHATKGTKIYVEGELETRKWQDNSGQDKYTTEIKARDFILLSKNSDERPQQNNSAASDFDAGDVPF